MRKLMLSFATLCALALLVETSTAQSPNVKSFVARNGSDSNACTQTSPCLTFEHAFLQTSSGGEIDCLTGGDFGIVLITQPITIDCGASAPGGIGLPSAVDAITVDVSSGGTVILRNLVLNGFGQSSGSGINASNFPNGTLIVQNCNIHGFTNGYGIYFTPSSGRGLLEVSYSALYGNADGISVNPASGVILSVVLNQDELNSNSSNGIYVVSNGVVAGTLRQSVVAANGGDGIYIGGSSQVYFTVEETSVMDNLVNGIETHSSAAFLNVGASTIGGNGMGVRAQTGAIYSFGNNQLSANGSPGNFTPGGPGLE